MGNSKSKLKRALSNSSNKNRPQNSSINVTNPQILNEEKEEKYYHLLNHDDVDRQHPHHFLRRYLFQNNFSSPIEENLTQGGCKVLDVGCGAGTWLLDVASRYKNSYFFGVDVSPVYPSEVKPGNLEFKEADLFNGLPFPDNEFDLTHQGGMSFFIKADQWNYVISELIRVTKPGGFIEITEYVSGAIGPVATEINDAHRELCSKRGINLDLLPKIGSIMELNPNITQAHQDQRTLIVGPGGGRAGIIMQELIIMFNTSESAINEITSMKGISRDEYVNMIITDFKNELRETKTELNLYRFWAQKMPNL